MSSISITNSERIAAIERLGYTEREAQFLCLAALHGGYFLRRQYCEFIGKQIGGTASALAEKLLSRHHAVSISALNNTKIYHLASRPFYAVLGETDNRNRREHSPAAMKKRLMGLDFVLAHTGYNYLATEREKLDYFSGTLGISLSTLPFKRYISLKTPSTTSRYFVDKYPVFLREEGPSEPRLVPAFCFVDEGLVTLSGFETYLQQYYALWVFLKKFEVIYVAGTKRLTASAHRAFRAFVNLLGRSDYDPNTRVAKRMIEYFEARLLYENGELASFSRDRLIRLRNETAEFCEPKYQALFERWKATGTQAVLDAIAPKSQLTTPLSATFSTHLIEHNYEFFGKIESPKDACL